MQHKVKRRPPVPRRLWVCGRWPQHVGVAVRGKGRHDTQQRCPWDDEVDDKGKGDAALPVDVDVGQQGWRWWVLSKRHCGEAGARDATLRAG